MVILLELIDSGDLLLLILVMVLIVCGVFGLVCWVLIYCGLVEVLVVFVVVLIGFG